MNEQQTCKQAPPPIFVQIRDGSDPSGPPVVDEVGADVVVVATTLGDHHGVKVVGRDDLSDADVSVAALFLMCGIAGALAQTRGVPAKVAQFCQRIRAEGMDVHSVARHALYTASEAGPYPVVLRRKLGERVLWRRLHSDGTWEVRQDEASPWIPSGEQPVEVGPYLMDLGGAGWDLDRDAT